MASSRQIRLVLFTTIALGAIAGGIYFVVQRQGRILSPGPLSSFHATLDNEPGCYECHTEATDFRGLSDQLCLECHQTLDKRISAERGYHAQVQGSCDTCHSEHAGVEVKLIRWPPADAPLKPTVLGSAEEEQAKRQAWPHEKTTGFPLKGAHAKLGCEQCHSINLVLDPAVVDFLRRPGAGEHSSTSTDYFESYLGLQTVCGDCHDDPHAPSMGSACDDCHTEDAWSPSTNFVHEPPNTRYALVGKHKDVACEKCHITQPPIETPPAPPGLPTFQPVVSTKRPPVFRGVGFGRSPARPVRGETLPECENCHANPHRQSSEVFWDCSDCHAETGWKPWKESGFDHDSTGFRLVQGHAKPSCADCHGKKQGDEGPLALPKREACADCHEDYHKGAFDREMALAQGKTCDVCHDVVDWKRPSYRKSDHPQAVPLEDTHGEIKCEDCHGKGPLQASCKLTRGGKQACVKGPPFTRLPARGQVRIGPLEQDCQSCHRDVHQGALSDPQLRGANCTDCHGFVSWPQGASFDRDKHAALGFPIRGAHVKIFDDCTGCHGKRGADGGLARVKIPNANQDCNACHQKDDVHKGQLGNDCTRCHSEQSWAPSSFTIAQHQETRFPLNGAHRAVPCEVCHKADARTKVQKWKWRSTECTSCHRSPHGLQFKGQACTECHTESAWSPSTFDISRHDKTRFKLEGAHDTECSKCHQPDPGGKVVRYIGTARTCSRCHEDVHMGQFSGRYKDCADCHVAVSWKPSFFDHDKARYKLDGAHRGVACDRCHQLVDRTGPDGKVRQVRHYYPIPGRSCDDCHQNPHELKKE